MSKSSSESSNSAFTDGRSDSSDECFVVAPINSPGTDIRERTDDLLDQVIRPVIEEDFGLDVIAPHEIDKPGNITRQVMRLLLRAELVVADLTDQNPNVMYELAVRHATGKPIIPIAKEGESLPFDIGPQRTQFYKHTMGGPDEFIPAFRSSVQAVLEEDYTPDNPIREVQRDFRVQETTAGEDVMEYIMDRLDKIETTVSTYQPQLSEAGLRLKASGDITAFADGIDRDVLFVDGDVYAGSDIGAGSTTLFEEVEAFCSTNSVKSEKP